MKAKYYHNLKKKKLAWEKVQLVQLNLLFMGPTLV